MYQNTHFVSCSNKWPESLCQNQGRHLTCVATETMEAGASQTVNKTVIIIFINRCPFTINFANISWFTVTTNLCSFCLNLHPAVIYMLMLKQRISATLPPLTSFLSPSFTLPLSVILCSRNPDALPLDSISPHLFHEWGVRLSPVFSFIFPLLILLADEPQGFQRTGAGVLEVLTALW